MEAIVVALIIADPRHLILQLRQSDTTETDEIQKGIMYQLERRK